MISWSASPRVSVRKNKRRPRGAPSYQDRNKRRSDDHPLGRGQLQLLREWRETDREPFAAMPADPAVMEMLLPFPNRAASDAWIARMQAHCDQHGFANGRLRS